MTEDKQRRAVCAAVARILQQRRITLGMSLAEVAAKAGLSYQMVGYVENQKRNPTLDTLLRIANALELDLSTVIVKATKAAGSQTK
jgi:transcriptional regulator with XRE-family HTH domain